MSSAAPDVTGTVFEDESPEVTRSYAEALINAAAAAGQVDAVLDEMDAILADVFGRSQSFAALLSSPSVRPEKKDQILTEAFEGRAHPMVARFLRVLNRHGRLGQLGPIARRARATWDRRQNRQPVTVRSAVPLDDAEQDALRQKLGRLLGGATAVLHLEVDPTLLGGLVVQVGDDVYDASIRNRLAQLRDQLAGGWAHGNAGHRDEPAA
ncbi:MAG TPA: ATP synthase F1 subunit delta [Isosphaeraceae bacterium]|jgi:F-type H+-transporting ATPase subunit delta